MMEMNPGPLSVFRIPFAAQRPFAAPRPADHELAAPAPLTRSS